MQDKGVVLRLEGAHFTCVGFSPDGTLLAAGDTRNTVTLWNAATGERSATLQCDGNAWAGCLAFSPDGKVLAAASSLTVTLWDVSSRQQIGDLPDSPQGRGVSTFAFAPSGTTLATGTRCGVVRLWDVQTLRSRTILRYSESPGVGELGRWRACKIDGLAFTPDGKTLAIAVWHGLVLYDLERQKEQRVLRGDDLATSLVEVSPDGKYLAAAIGAGVKVWDLGSDKELGVRVGGGRPGGIRFMGNTGILALTYDDALKFPGELAFHDLAVGEEIVRFYCHRDVTNDLAFSPDGKRLATCSRDRTVKVWRVADILPARTASGTQPEAEKK